jgi:hypothetical protein
VWVCLLWPAFVCVWPRLLCVLLSVLPWLLRLSAPMLLGVSLVPLCNTMFILIPGLFSGWRAFSSVSLCQAIFMLGEIFAKKTGMLT